ncbi:hypothetical protein ISP17_18990 [Dyella ginsengisoli]|uniref:Uncharacterized protein n=1 Tax=Dyella ginsengisoli TaxID=363848 RepID=A0ABW8JYW8_9GAMM
MTTRKFTMEGGLHIFSSLPSILTPADIYRVARSPDARAHLVGSNVYIIACRQRILFDQREFHLDGEFFCGFLLVVRDGGWQQVAFRYRLTFGHHQGSPDQCGVAISVNGTSALISNHIGQVLIAVHVVVSEGECGLSDDERDLNVLYVGQGLGLRGQKLAVDRLSRHSTFQRILADFHTHHPEMEILILLYRFEHARNLISSGGNMALVPTANERQDVEHLRKMQKARFDRRKRIALAEAALINYFKPAYNSIFTNTNFASNRRLKFLNSIVTEDMVGLVVELSTSNLRLRLRSEAQPPVSLDQSTLELMRGFVESPACDGEARSEIEGMMMSHRISIPLTNVDERDSFLHGTRWPGDDDRMPYFSGSPRKAQSAQD